MRVREQIKVAIPIEWERNRKAGLCSVCGKHPDEFEPRRKVYCSENCAKAYSDKIIYWSSLRDKLIEENPKCANCGITHEKKKQQEEEEIKKNWLELMKKHSDELRALKFKRLAEEEESFIRKVKEIEEASWEDWNIQHELERLTGKRFSKYALGGCGFEVDHKVAICNGGDMWDKNNLQVLCGKCHKKKTKKDLAKKEQKNSQEAKTK